MLKTTLVISCCTVTAVGNHRCLVKTGDNNLQLTLNWPTLAWSHLTVAITLNEEYLFSQLVCRQVSEQIQYKLCHCLLANKAFVGHAPKHLTNLLTLVGLTSLLIIHAISQQISA